MKRIIAIMLCVLLLALCGCTPEKPQDSEPVQTTAPAETTVPNTSMETTAPTQPQEVRLPLNAISLPQIFHYDTTDNYETIMRYSYPEVSFLYQDTAVANAVVIDLRNRVDHATADAQSIASSAADYYADTGFVPGYFRELTADITRMDQGVVSLLLSHSSYTGGMRPNSWLEGATYDLVTGQSLTLSQILEPNTDISFLAQLLLDELSKLEGLYTNYEDTVVDMFRRDTLPANWYLTDMGLCFFFNTYDIAPYVAGPIHATVPYEKLTGILDDAWFPPEKLSGSGTLQAILFDQADQSRFDRYAELVTDPKGTHILLFPEGTITDIRIDQGQWDYDGVKFYPESTVFASPVLYSGDAISVTTMVPEIMPDLRIQYTSNGETVTRYLLLSGKDGSALLIE